MKPYHQQTYYELLEISPDATQEEIRAAYERVSQNYAPDSVAIYSLADPAQAEDLRQRIVEAFEYLSEPDLRREYDRGIGLSERSEQPAVVVAPVVAAPPVPDPVEPRGEQRADSDVAEEGLAASQPPASSENLVAAAVERREVESAQEAVNEAPPVAAESATPAPIPAVEASAATSAPSVAEQSPATAAPSSAATGSATVSPGVAEPSSAPLPGQAGADDASSSTRSAQQLTPANDAHSEESSEAKLPPQPESVAPELPPEPKSTPRAKPQAASEARTSTEPKSPAAEEPPSQITMQELLRRSERAATSSHIGNVSVSYIPHPPRPERAEPMTLAAPSWAATEAAAAPASTPAPRSELSERVELAPAPPPPAVEPPPLPRAQDRASELKPRRVQQLAGAAEIAQESAIASAEAALAQVSARARENRPNKPLEIPPDAEFNGELLRKIRQAKNLTVQQVADRTKIGRNHLENVEADRYDALPTTVYLRGILMNIAREYGLDPLRVSKSYLALVPSKK